MKLTDIVIQQIIRQVVMGKDYRSDILALINSAFMEYTIAFFERVAHAKLRNTEINVDWYKREFVTNPDLATTDMIIHAGLNKKTLDNSYGSSSRKVVLEVVPEYYDHLYHAIHELAQNNDAIDITLTIKLRSVSVDLNITESLIVINTLAVKRAQLRGGAWSTTGKSVEKYLMLTLCKLFDVPEQHYQLAGMTDESREIDFILITPDQRSLSCEVKLMGKGNPESADAVIARVTDIFIADTLSSLNKAQLTGREVEWVALRDPDGYLRFYDILKRLGIPSQLFTEDLETRLNNILPPLFPV